MAENFPNLMKRIYHGKATRREMDQQYLHETKQTLKQINYQRKKGIS